MAETTILFAVKNIDDLLIQHAGFLQGLYDDHQGVGCSFNLCTPHMFSKASSSRSGGSYFNILKCLKDELQRIQLSTHDAVEKQDNDERIRKWISDVRDVARDADYITDAFVLKVVQAASTSIGSSKLIGKQIENIRSKIRDIERRRERYKIEDDIGEGIEYSLRPEISRRQKDKQLVGMDEDVEFLLEKVVWGKSEGLSIASIVGAGGIGKSTLAQIIYEHGLASEQFDQCVWAAVSGEFTPKDVIKELMLQLLRPPHDKIKEAQSLEELPLSSIEEMLRRSLHDARVFVVLDDVGQDAQWESIASAFTIEDKGSRLLLTSRNEDIAKNNGYVHKMKTFDSDKSWELFTNKVLINSVDGKFPEDLETIGGEILKKCDGLPLAITLVGGLLGDKNPSKRKWEKVLDDININFGSRTTLSTILELSYRDLPPQLKSCFLCLSFFKERVPIRAEKLVQVWIAEGLVIPLEGGGEEETKEVIGRRYLDELINRNLVEIKDLCIDGRIKSCCMDDLIRELSVTKAKKEISFEIQREDGKSRLRLDKPRHLAIYGGGDQRFVYTSENQNEHVHSVFFHGVGNFVNDNPSYLNTFELLKILDFEDLPIESLPETIGLLIWLRYLGLRNTRIESLPQSVGRLKNLEVLDITKVYQVEVDDVLWEMESLRHIYGGMIYSEYLLKTNTLKNLQTLGYVYVENLIPAHIIEMNNLRKLSLFIAVSLNFDGGKFYPLLAMLENLACLELKWGPFVKVRLSELKGLDTLHRVTRLKLDGTIVNLPNASEFPPNLSSLTLLRTLYDHDPMPVLEKLPKLRYLKMDCAYSSNDDMVVSEEGFPVLEFLILRRMVTLNNIRVGKGAMPKLKRTQIYKCGENLGTDFLPEELEFTRVLP